MEQVNNKDSESIANYKKDLLDFDLNLISGQFSYHQLIFEDLKDLQFYILFC